jgi:ketosteroid isomerase-like protein
MKYLFAVFAACFASSGLAQKINNADIQSLVEAERAFAAMAKEKNTREAFLFFLADDAVTSAPGLGPRIGKKHLEEQEPNEGYLHWYPVFSDIASSRDFGYNTGPWEFREKRSDEKPVAFGEFVSVWEKNAQGEWKVAIDIGIGHGEPAAEAPPLTTSRNKLQGGKKHTSAEKNKLYQFEKTFIREFSEKGNGAYLTLLSDEAKFFRGGSLPFTTSKQIKDLLAGEQRAQTYTFMGGDVASSGDLAYVYGKVTFQIIKDNRTQTKQGSYMRFYKKEDGKTWRIVLDLLTN